MVEIVMEVVVAMAEEAVVSEVAMPAAAMAGEAAVEAGEAAMVPTGIALHSASTSLAPRSG